jgi:hypothetical protein
MIIKGTFKFDKNIVLDESAIKDLHQLLLQDYAKITYSAKTKNEKNINIQSEKIFFIINSNYFIF